MALATWWASDPLPSLRQLANFYVQPSADDLVVAGLNGLTVDEVARRRTAGHRPYVGYLKGIPVAYGWCATQQASIGELGLEFVLPVGNRYLWDFATLPAWQRRGIYPHLLRAILAQEWPEAERFWIIFAPENLPSGAGMHKAGFTPVGELSFRADGTVALASLHPRALAGAALLGVPLLTDELAPCWHCASRPATHSGKPDACWPPAPQHQGNVCTCATPVRPPADG